MRRMPLARRRIRLGAVAVGLVATLALPALVLAHPLGNFTINHYAGIRVEPERVLLDIVIDQAEIPTFQARLTFDTDGDGEVSDPEADVGRITACDGLTPSLDLTVGGTRQALLLTDAGLTFPPGVGGLSTMRFVCAYRADLGAAVTGDTTVSFADTSFPDRLGWREIVVQGSGMSVTATQGALRTATISKRLTIYPTNQLAKAPADTAVALRVGPGGPTLAPFVVPDATPVAAVIGNGPVASTPAPTTPATMPQDAPVAAAGVAGGVPGGVTGGELPSIFRAADLTPFVLLVSLLTAGALGAGHALTPGHGKTLMAAYSSAPAARSSTPSGLACRSRCRTPSASWCSPASSSEPRTSLPRIRSSAGPR